MRHAVQNTTSDRLDGSEGDDRAAAASYVATLATDLAELARRHGLDTLGYILEMARLEAENTVRTSSDRN